MNRKSEGEEKVSIAKSSEKQSDSKFGSSKHVDDLFEKNYLVNRYKFMSLKYFVNNFYKIQA